MAQDWRRTAGGYDVFEVLSAVQKAVRRGQEEEAMWWACEMAESSARHASMLWNRLRTIAQEDVGIADLTVVCAVETLAAGFNDCRKRSSNSDMLYVANAVLALSRAPKSRLADNFQMAIRARRAVGKQPIPDYALDKHTQRGKAMGRGWDHWITEGTLLAHQPLDDRYQSEAEAACRTGVFDKPTASTNGSLFDDGASGDPGP